MAGSDKTKGAKRRYRRSDAEARKARALPLLVAGLGYAEVAAQTGVSERSIRRWVSEDEEFRARLEAARDAASARAQEVIVEHAADAIADVLERRRFWTSMMRDEGAEPKDRLKASELLGRAGGDFVERREVSGPDGGPVETQVVQVVLAPEVALECAQEGSKG